jgi:hypothetical protein
MGFKPILGPLIFVGCLILIICVAFVDTSCTSNGKKVDAVIVGVPYEYAVSVEFEGKQRTVMVHYDDIVHMRVGDKIKVTQKKGILFGDIVGVTLDKGEEKEDDGKQDI